MRKNNKVLITGATGGIGKALTFMLCEQETPIILACRDEKKAIELKKEVLTKYPKSDITIINIDLSSLDSIQSAVGNLIKILNGEKIAALVNNAGIIAQSFCQTSQGWEMNVGVNYIGTWALTNLLAPHIKENGKIVNVISCTTKVSKIDESFLERALCPNKNSSYNRLKRYGESKLALLLSAKEMAVRFEDIIVCAADPGIVDTNIITMNKWFDTLADIFFRPFIKTPKQGALTIYRALNDNHTDKRCVNLYRGKKHKSTLQLSVKDDNMAKKLWVLTQNKVYDFITVQ